MKLPRLRTILLAPLVLFALFYVAAVLRIAFTDDSIEGLKESPAANETIAIFGASGTAGDGILKAALANPDIDKIHVITRRTTPRIEEGVSLGKVQMTIHMDYLDYSAIHEQISEASAVYWAIGISSIGVDEETYGMIHVDFPLQFVSAWTSVSARPDMSFHYISSSDISADSSAMWAREKVRAENSLFEFAKGSNLRVIAYRPDYIRPTEEETGYRAESSLLVFCSCQGGSGGNANRTGNDRSDSTRFSNSRTATSWVPGVLFVTATLMSDAICPEFLAAKKGAPLEAPK